MTVSSSVASIILIYRLNFATVGSGQTGAFTSRLPELAATVAKLDTWAAGKRFLLVVEQAQRREVRAIVTALKLAQMSEAHLALDSHWRTHFERKLAQQGSGAISVNTLRAWLNEPKAMGLPPELENLILLTFAAQTNRAWFRFGSSPHAASIDDLPSDAELREQVLPDDEVWNRAVERAAAVFGLSPSPLKSAANAAKLSQELGLQVANLVEPARDLLRELQSRLTSFGVTHDSSQRLKTAQVGLGLLESFRTAPEQERISLFANAKLDEKGVSVGTSLKQAQTVARALRDAPWVVIESAAKVQDQRRSAGEVILKRTRELFQLDELAQPLVVTLRRIQDDAAKLLAETPTPVASSVPTSPGFSVPPSDPTRASTASLAPSSTDGAGQPSGQPGEH